MPTSKHPLKLGMHATAAGVRGTVIGLDFLPTMWKGRNIMAPTVDLSTPDGLFVNIPVRSLD